MAGKPPRRYCMNNHVLLNAIAAAVLGGITALVFIAFSADLMSNLGFHLKSTLLFSWLFAVLVPTPEAFSAFSAALSKRLQRSINICLGPALSTIGLTVPAVLAIGMITSRDAELGLIQQETVLLVVTLFVSGMTFGGDGAMSFTAWGTSYSSSPT